MTFVLLLVFVSLVCTSVVRSNSRGDLIITPSQSGGFVNIAGDVFNSLGSLSQYAQTFQTNANFLKSNTLWNLNSKRYQTIWGKIQATLMFNVGQTNYLLIEGPEQSQLFKYDPISSQFQSVGPGVGGNPCSLSTVTIGSSVYIFKANNDNVTATPALFLFNGNTNPPSFSLVYNFTGSTESFQSYLDPASISTGRPNYIFVQARSSGSSLLYSISESGVQPQTGYGYIEPAYAIDFMTLPTSVLMVVAYKNTKGSGNAHVTVSTLGKNSPPVIIGTNATIPATIPTDVLLFNQSGFCFLAIADQDAYSSIWLYNGSQFNLFQSIPYTQGIQWKLISANGATYLLLLRMVGLANGGTNLMVDSPVYRWSGSLWVPFSSVSNINPTSCDSTTIAGTAQLVVAGSGDSFSYAVPTSLYRLSIT